MRQQKDHRFTFDLRYIMRKLLFLQLFVALVASCSLDSGQMIGSLRELPSPRNGNSYHDVVGRDFVILELADDARKSGLEPLFYSYFFSASENRKQITLHDSDYRVLLRKEHTASFDSDPREMPQYVDGANPFTDTDTD